MSRYFGDFDAGATVRIPFNSRTAAGAAITLAGTPSAAVLKDAGTAEATAGVTLSVDHDSKTGTHYALIDTSADAFYAAGADFDVFLAAGTVDGESVAGTFLGSFSIANRNRDADVVSLDGDPLTRTLQAGTTTSLTLASTEPAQEGRSMAGSRGCRRGPGPDSSPGSPIT